MNRIPHTLLSLVFLLTVAACSSTPERKSDNRRSIALQQLAQSVMTDSGHVSVTVDGDVAFVSGFVESAIDALAIVNALKAAEGIETVRNGIQREM